MSALRVYGHNGTRRSCRPLLPCQNQMMIHQNLLVTGFSSRVLIKWILEGSSRVVLLFIAAFELFREEEMKCPGEGVCCSSLLALSWIRGFLRRRTVSDLLHRSDRACCCNYKLGCVCFSFTLTKLLNLCC